MPSTAKASRPEIDSQERYRETRRVTLVGSLLDVFLVIIKLWGGWFAHSQALIADGIHSLSDLATNIVVLVAAKHSHQGADDLHPYGHGRVETVATVVLGLSLVVVGCGIAYDAVHRLFTPELLLRPGIWALLIAAFSVLSKELLYHYTMRSARRLRSNILRANAWHCRSDAISSIVVIIGVAGSMAGLPYVDAIAAIVVAAMIAKIGAGFVWSSTQELIDTGLDAEAVENIRETISTVDGVSALHMLRTRKMAGQVFVDVHIMLEQARISVSEGHQISEAVRGRLIRSIDDVSDVTVHIDPEDDEQAMPNRALSPRARVLTRLHKCWKAIDVASEIQNITLHYLDGKIHLDLQLPLSCLQHGQSSTQLTEAFAAAVRQEDDIAEVRLFFCGDEEHQKGA